MTPAQFIADMKRKEIAPAYLFLGSEAYDRLRAREALVAAVLGDDREAGLTRHDMAEITLAEVIDDARALSLFASQRVIVVANAEAALPRGRASEEEGDAEGGGTAGAGLRLGVRRLRLGALDALEFHHRLFASLKYQASTPSRRPTRRVSQAKLRARKNSTTPSAEA